MAIRKPASDESGLPAAIDDLYAAVAALVDDRKELVNGSMMVAPSLYDCLTDEIPASKGDYIGRFNGKSRPPMWVDAFDLQAQIDTRVGVLQPEGTSTPDRLRIMAARRWRPQDVRAVREAANEIRSWSVSIQSLIDPQHVKTVAASCPSCGSRWFYRQLAGENVRQPALQLVVHQGCSCMVCGAFWEPARYLWLCKLLGFTLPEGLLA